MRRRYYVSLGVIVLLLVGWVGLSVKKAADIYIYLYPLAIFQKTLDVMTNTKQPAFVNNKYLTPYNQVVNYTGLWKAENRSVVRPNIDTIYSLAAIDLSNGPVVFSMPAIPAGRYVLNQFVDSWGDVALSYGTEGEALLKNPTNYILVGRDYKGTIPSTIPNAHILMAKDNAFFTIVRTQYLGDGDLPKIQALQAQYKITPLEYFGKAYKAPLGTVNPSQDMHPAPDQVETMDGEAFLKYALVQFNKAHMPEADAPMAKKLASFGIVHGTADYAQLSWVSKSILKIGASIAKKKLYTAAPPEATAKTNYWSMIYIAGAYGVDYTVRAYVALIGFGANIVEDAAYPITGLDGNGKPLVGGKKYTLRFEPSALPPANAFWSVTAYQDNFLILNPINRYAIASWMMSLKKGENLVFDADGSLTIYIQPEAPSADKMSNWLPSPKDGKNVSIQIRVYAPQQILLDKQWTPPAIQPVE